MLLVWLRLDALPRRCQAAPGTGAAGSACSRCSSCADGAQRHALAAGAGSRVHRGRGRHGHSDRRLEWHRWRWHLLRWQQWELPRESWVTATQHCGLYWRRACRRHLVPRVPQWQRRHVTDPWYRRRDTQHGSPRCRRRRLTHRRTDRPRGRVAVLPVVWRVREQRARRGQRRAHAWARQVAMRRPAGRSRWSTVGRQAGARVVEEGIGPFWCAQDRHGRRADWERRHWHLWWHLVPAQAPEHVDKQLAFLCASRKKVSVWTTSTSFYIRRVSSGMEGFFFWDERRPLRSRA